MTHSRWARNVRAGLMACAIQPIAVHAATPAELQASYGALAGTTADVSRGQQLFTTRHGRDWSCSSCHGAVPTQPGKHASTGKPIAPLAPAR